MANETTFLGLTLPGLGEFTDSWNEPMNANFEAIDAWANLLNTEVVEARFSKTSLKNFLAVAHKPDGTLYPMPEIIEATNSPVYGDKPAGTGVDPYTLSDRVDLGDLEVLAAREGKDALRDALASRAILAPDMIVSGLKDMNGNPAWLSAAGDEATLNGAATPIWFMVGGYLCRIRTNKAVKISGAAGWKYLYVQFQPNGTLVVDGDSLTPPPSTGNGVTTLDLSGDKRWFTDPTHYFAGVLKDVDVQPGDALTILPPPVGDPGDAGTYYVKTLGVDGDDTKLEIVGLFPGSVGMSGLNYTITDPLGVEVGFTDTKTAVAGRLYVSEVYFDGTAVIQDPGFPLRPYHFKDTYVGDWRYFDVSTAATQTEIWEHRLGSDIVDISVQVSQANDGSAPIEELSLADVKNTLTPSVTTPLVNVAYTPGVAGGDPVVGSSVSATLSAAVGVSLTGAVVPNRSVKAKWTRNQVFIKNAVQYLLYTDYDAGTERQTGYVRVVVRKRG